MAPTKPKIAIVHDWLTNFAGAEQVVRSLLEIFPEAPVYTSMYKPEKLPQVFRDKKVYTTSLQKYSFIPHQLLFPMMGKAFEEFDLSDYDVVISSSHASSKGIITKPETLHISYCHTPTRYLWSHYFEYLDQMQFGLLNPLVKWRMPKIAYKLRMWDRLAADRVDLWVANSKNTAKRINKYYRKNATVIYPPVNTSLFSLSTTTKNYYLICSRLIPYKKIDLVIETFNELGKELIVVGTGPLEKEFKKMAKKNIKILGRVSDEELKQYYNQAKAFIFPAEEDFGIVPIESMASGRPVIAYGKGGATETVIEGKTGIHFEEQTKASLKKAIKKFEEMSFDSTAIRNYALQFSNENFKKKFKDFIEIEYEKFSNNRY